MGKIRSLNLGNSVAIVLYEALRPERICGDGKGRAAAQAFVEVICDIINPYIKLKRAPLCDKTIIRIVGANFFYLEIHNIFRRTND